MGLIWYQIYEDCAMNNEIIGWYCHNWNTYFLLIKEIDRVGGESVLQNQIEYLNQRCNTDRIFKILRTMEIFWSCLLPKMRLSIDLEGRYIRYNATTYQAVIIILQPCRLKVISVLPVSLVFSLKSALCSLHDVLIKVH